MVTSMALLDALIVFILTFVITYVVCAHNVTLSKMLCPVSLATIMTYLAYTLL